MTIELPVKIVTQKKEVLHVNRYIIIPTWTIGSVCCALCNYPVEDQTTLVADLGSGGRNYFHEICFSGKAK